MSIIKDKQVSETNPMPYELVRSGEVATLLNAQAGVAISPSLELNNINTAIVVTSTASATVNIEVSLDNINWAVGATSTLTVAGSDPIIIQASWRYIRANVTASTGNTTVKAGY